MKTECSIPGTQDSVLEKPENGRELRRRTSKQALFLLVGTVKKKKTEIREAVRTAVGIKNRSNKKKKKNGAKDRTDSKSENIMNKNEKKTKSRRALS